MSVIHGLHFRMEIRITIINLCAYNLNKLFTCNTIKIDSKYEFLKIKSHLTVIFKKKLLFVGMSTFG